MTERERTTKGKPKFPSFITMTGALLCLLLIFGYISATLYLETPSAARRVSRLLTDYLHYPVAMTALRFSAGTLSIYGLTVGNPADFNGGELAASRSIDITPDWPALLRGRKSFEEIVIRGLSVRIGRNGRGQWNFGKIARLLSEKKGGGEVSVKRLRITQSALAVEQFGIDHLAATVNNFSSKGITSSYFLVTCKDADGNPLRLEGQGRIGAAPSLDAILRAPSFSLKSFARMIGKRTSPAVATGRGSFYLRLKVAAGKMAGEGKLHVEQVPIQFKTGQVPLSADLNFVARYDARQDDLFLDSSSLRVNGLVNVQAAGQVRQARAKRMFDATLSMDDMDLKTLYAMLPQELRHGLVPAGKLSAAKFRFTGDGVKGITSGSGAIFLRKGEVARGGRLLAKDVTADISILKVKEGWQLRGKVSQPHGGNGVLQSLNAPLTALFSDRLRPLHAEVPSFTVTVSGITAQGMIGYRPGGATPVSLKIEVRKAPAGELNALFPAKEVAWSGGTVAFFAQAAGKGPQDLQGYLKVEVSDVKGSAAGRQFAVKRGTTEAEFKKGGGSFSATGKIRSSGSLDDKAVALSCSYGISSGHFYISDGALASGVTKLHLGMLRGEIPQPLHAGEVTRLPLRLELNGLAAGSSDFAVDGIAGNLSADYVSDHGRRWLEGKGRVSAGKATYKGSPLGSAEGIIRFAEHEATAEVKGTLLEGRMTAAANFDPFELKKGTVFRANLAEASGAGLAPLTRETLPVKITGGLFSGKLEGSYAGGEGLRCRIEAGGKRIDLTARDGKSLLMDGALHTICDWSGDKLLIREGLISTGSGFALKMGGSLAHPLSPEREGELSLSVAVTPVDVMLTTFVNVLPRMLQEATAGGNMGAHGTIRVKRSQVMLDGALSLQKASLEVPSQQFAVGGMTGGLPFSFELTGAGGAKPEKRRYSRDKYPMLLAALRQASKTERSVNIGRIRFGGVEFGATSVAVRAGNGLVEMTSLDSSLFEGALLGEGFFRYGKRMQYGADMIINNLSLRTLCNSFPKIKGYLSGRVDSIMSLYGEGSGLSGLRGFIDIWTRSVPDEKMLVSKEFLQKLAGRKFKGIFFRNDRPYDRGEIRGYLDKGYISFDTLDISHTNLFGIKDLSVSVAPVQNRISVDHLYSSIKEAATRGKAVGGAEGAPQAPPESEFKWEE